MKNAAIFNWLGQIPSAPKRGEEKGGVKDLLRMIPWFAQVKESWHYQAAKPVLEAAWRAMRNLNGVSNVTSPKFDVREWYFSLAYGDKRYRVSVAWAEYPEKQKEVFAIRAWETRRWWVRFFLPDLPLEESTSLICQAIEQAVMSIREIEDFEWVDDYELW